MAQLFIQKKYFLGIFLVVGCSLQAFEEAMVAYEQATVDNSVLENIKEVAKNLSDTFKRMAMRHFPTTFMQEQQKGELLSEPAVSIEASNKESLMVNVVGSNSEATIPLQEKNLSLQPAKVPTWGARELLKIGGIVAAGALVVGGVTYMYKKGELAAFGKEIKAHPLKYLVVSAFSLVLLDALVR